MHFSPNLYVSFRPVARGAFENCPIGAWYSRSRPSQNRGSRGFNSRGRGNFQKASKTRIFVQKLPRKRKNAPGRCIFQGGRVGRVLQPQHFPKEVALSALTFKFGGSKVGDPWKHSTFLTPSFSHHGRLVDRPPPPTESDNADSMTLFY